MYKQFIIDDIIDFHEMDRKDRMNNPNTTQSMSEQIVMPERKEPEEEYFRLVN